MSEGQILQVSVGLEDFGCHPKSNGKPRTRPKQKGDPSDLHFENITHCHMKNGVYRGKSGVREMTSDDRETEGC